MLDRLFLLYLGSILLLNYGAQMLRVPPIGFGVPLGEIFLLVYFLRVNILASARNMEKIFPVALFLLWIIYGMLHIAQGVILHGAVAIRDGSPLIESLYLLIGFSFARKSSNLRMLYKLFRRMTPIIIIYLLLYSVKGDVVQYTPHLPSSQGMLVPLLFFYISTPTVCLATSALYFERYLKGKNVKFALTAALLIILPMLFLPSRTFILQLLMFFGLFLFITSLTGKLKIIGILMTLLAMFFIISSLGLVGTNRIGQELTGSMYMQLFTEIFDASYEGGGASSGNAGRILWWLSIFNQVTSSWGSFFFGLGYGVPLTDLVLTGGTVVREPHNTLISVFGRLGFLGFLMFVVLQILFVRNFIEILRLSNGSYLRPLVLYMVTFEVCTLIFSLGESPFIAPYFAIPYYFFAGVMIRMVRFHKRGML